MVQKFLPIIFSLIALVIALYYGRHGHNQMRTLKDELEKSREQQEEMLKEACMPED
jgi:hypothetical protein